MGRTAGLILIAPFNLLPSLPAPRPPLLQGVVALGLSHLASATPLSHIHSLAKMLVDLSIAVVALASTALAYPSGKHSQLEARASTLAPADGIAAGLPNYYLASTNLLREFACLDFVGSLSSDAPRTFQSLPMPTVWPPLSDNGPH